MSPLPKKYRFNNRIRLTLKVVVIPLYILFNGASHVDNKVCVENMHILANMRPEIYIKGSLITFLKFVTIWVVTGGGVGSRQTVTKSDKGEGDQKSVVDR